MIYSTNTIHIGSVVLARHLDLLLLPQHLSKITSLELLLDLILFRPPSSPQQEQTMGWPAYHGVLSALPTSLPSLRKLQVSISTNSYIANPLADNIESHERNILGPVDDMVRNFGRRHLRHCEIAPNRSLYTAFRLRAEKVGARIGSGGVGAFRWERFWRAVAVKQEGDQQQQQQSNNNEELGYWVRQGVDDTPL